jgi:tRNA pseudouridine38-40 synthase
MATYQSIIAYDGTDFLGFQRQAENIRTVQGVLEGALRRLNWNAASLKAAGRTDAGVHASGQVVSFNLDWGHTPEDLSRAMNANLPQDLSVLRTAVVADDFHARYSALRRRYRYTVFSAEVRNPLRERYAWRVRSKLDGEAMQAAASMVPGKHNFAAFGTAPKAGGHTIREVFQAHWQEKQDGWAFEIEANAFLYHMVRRLVAATVMVGHGKMHVESVRELIDDPQSRFQGKLAPACGLCLEAVIYNN